MHLLPLDRLKLRDTAVTRNSLAPIRDHCTHRCKSASVPVGFPIMSAAKVRQSPHLCLQFPCLLTKCPKVWRNPDPCLWIPWAGAQRATPSPQLEGPSGSTCLRASRSAPSRPSRQETSYAVSTSCPPSRPRGNAPHPLRNPKEWTKPEASPPPRAGGGVRADG